MNVQNENLPFGSLKFHTHKKKNRQLNITKVKLYKLNKTE